MGQYNGHESKAAWNVSLWINNDEGLYDMARRFARRYTRDEAAANMLAELNGLGITHTPDGHRYSKSTIKAAMREI